MPTDELKTHYVAHLKIERVDKPAQMRSLTQQNSDREISEVTQITLKGATLISLIDKLGKHIEIIEED